MEKDIKSLADPFLASDIEWFIGAMSRDKTKGLAIPFITNRAVQDRLDEVCGIDGWRNEYRELRERDEYDKNGVIIGRTSSYLCGISIWSEKRGEWITKWDGADGTDIESLKGGLSGAMKRAATQFGIGRYLYKLENPWVEVEESGRSYKIKANQKLILPDWALPGGSGTPLDGASRQVTVQTIGYDAQLQDSTTTAQPQQVRQNSNRKLSEKQVDRALKKAAAAGQSHESVIQWIQQRFEVSDIALLSRQQYDALCDALDRIPR